MKLSVILPCYNVSNYLDKCIKSLLKQNLEDVEFIFVDDCSPDNSSSIINSYNDKRIRYIKNETNMGVGFSRNFGYESSRGDYIAFLDPDDYVDDNMYAFLLQTALQNDADIVECKTVKVYEQDSVYKNPQTVNLKDVNFKIFKDLDIVKNIEHGLVHSIWCKIYKRSLIEDVRFPLNGFTDDATFNFKLMLKAKKLVYVDKGLHYYLQRDGGWTKKEIKEQTLQGVIDNILSIKEFIKTFDYEKQLYETYNELIAKFFITCVKTICGYSNNLHIQMKYLIDLFLKITDIQTLKLYLNRYYPFYLSYISKVYKNLGKKEYDEILALLSVSSFDRLLSPIKSVKRVFQYVKDRGISWTVKSLIQMLLSAKK